MEIGLTNESNYKNIANAIRAKNGSVEMYAPSEMADAIAAIPTPDVEAYIEAHDTSADAHQDIRAAIGDLQTKVGDTSVSAQIAEAISQATQVQIITWEADD